MARKLTASAVILMSRIRYWLVYCVHLCTLAHDAPDTVTVQQSLMLGHARPEDVTEFCIVVDASDSPVAAIGECFPNLRHLVLNDSILVSLRDLGTAYQKLQVLEVNRCCLSDLDGIAAFPNLLSLIAKDNSIADVSQLALHDSLQYLDIEGNAIEDESALMHLALCPHLRRLDIADTPLGALDNVSALVLSHLPQLLELICNRPNTGVDKRQMQTASFGCPSYAREGLRCTQAVAGKPQSAGSDESSLNQGLESECTIRDVEFDAISVSTWDRPDSGGLQRAATDSHKEDPTLNDMVVFAGSAALAMRKRRVAGALSSPVRILAPTHGYFEGNSSSRSLSQRPVSAARPSMTAARANIIQRPSSALPTCNIAPGTESPPLPPNRQHAAEDSFILDDVDDVSCSLAGSSEELSILAVLDAAKLEEEQRKKCLIAELEVWRAGQLQNSAIAASRSQNSSQLPAVDRSHPRDSSLLSSIDKLATAYDDATLITMLRCKPKNVPQLHSRDNFRRFFSGTAITRMRTLLQTAYSDVEMSEASEKIRKRLELLEGVLV
jgi:hypothetical protein